MALYDPKTGRRFSGHRAGLMIAARFDSQPDVDFPYMSDILGSDWLVGDLPRTRSQYRQLCIEIACKVYDPSAQFC